MQWQQGRAEIEHMLADGELQRVPPSREQADRLLKQARSHLRSAAVIAQDDPEGGGFEAAGTGPGGVVG